METSHFTEESLEAMSSLLGLKVGQNTIKELLPQIQRASQSMAKLNEMDMRNVEPSIIFKPQSE